MRKNLQAIALLKNLSTGIIIPVLTLMIIAHGATISTVSLMIGAYSLTVAVVEFPSGVFADLYGRKRAFFISTLFTLGCYTLLLLSHTPALLLLAMVLNGLGRAFSSGSLEAIALDETKDDAALVKVTARLSILESAGLAVGALLGGVLAGIGTDYNINITVVIAINAALLLLTQFTVHEPSRAAAPGESEEHTGLAALLRGNYTFLTKRGTIRMIVVLTLITGFAMLSMETYWQPALLSFTPPSWLLGVLSSAGYAAVIFGSKMTEHWFTKKPESGVTLLLVNKALMGLLIAGLMAASGLMPFIGAYMLWYLTLGASSVAESTLLNREAPSRQRASILSLFSLLVQIGGLLGSLCGYIVSSQTDFRMIWLLSGGLLLVSTAGFTLRRVFGKAPQQAPLETAVQTAVDDAGTYETPQ